MKDREYFREKLEWAIQKNNQKDIRLYTELLKIALDADIKAVNQRIGATKAKMRRLERRLRRLEAKKRR